MKQETGKRLNRFIITMVRKSDGAVFFRTPSKTYVYDKAVDEATRSARELSRTYIYVVTELKDVLGVQIDDAPVKTTYYS